MTKEFEWVSLREVLNRCLRHPLMLEITIELVALYAADFMCIVGCPKFFENREDIVQIDNYRGILPCDVIQINLVKDCQSGYCLRGMTDTFNPTRDRDYAELLFKTLGRVIFTSFKTGEVLVSYKSIPIDDDGLPMLPDNPNFLKALELYIKREVFTVLFDMGEVLAGVMLNVQQQYSWYVGLCISEFTIPSPSEMDSVKNLMTSFTTNMNSFDKGFRDLGNREYIKRQ